MGFVRILIYYLCSLIEKVPAGDCHGLRPRNDSFAMLYVKMKLPPCVLQGGGVLSFVFTE